MDKSMNSAQRALAEGVAAERVITLEEALESNISKIRAIGTLIGSMEPTAVVSASELAGLARLLDLIAIRGRLALDAECYGGGK